jgi:hypothetical protein
MSRRASEISIRLTAGTGQFIADMENAGAKVLEFRRKVDEAGGGGFSPRYAIFGLKDIMEGRYKFAFAEAINEVMRFRGALLAASVGGIALAGVGIAVYEVSKHIREAREEVDKLRAAFRQLNDPLRISNDQLQVANDRLANDIAKLQGHQQNGLKLALDEARLAADKLAESLDHDIAQLHKLVGEQGIGLLHGLLTGSGSTTDINKELGGETGAGGFRARVAALKDNASILREYNKEIQHFTGLIAQAEKAAAPHVQNMPIPGAPGATYQTSTPGLNETARLEILRAVVRNLQSEMEHVQLLQQNTSLQGTKSTLQANAENAALGRPFSDRMNAMGAQLDAVRVKLLAIGQPEWAQNLIKSFEDGRKAITEINKELERHHTKLSEAQMGQLTLKALQLAQAESADAWRQKLVSSTLAIDERTRATERLTTAIGKGYAAARSANVETQLAGMLGEHANDPAWMKSHAADVAGLRSSLSAEYDANNQTRSLQAADRLNDQIELEKSLAAVQIQGADAVQRVTLAYRLRDLYANGATREEIKAEIDLFNAQRANLSAANVAALNAKVTAAEKVTAAIFKGAEAQRQANLEAKYSEMQRGGSTTADIAAQRKLDEAEYQEKVTEEAARSVTAYQDQLDNINRIVAAIQKQKAEQGDTLALELALRDLENQRLDLMIQQELRLKTAGGDVRAFFLEMQRNAQESANIIYDSLNNALDRVSDQLSKLFTGQKTNWGQMFQELGGEMVKASIKQGLELGLGKIGSAFGLGTKADGSEASPFYVRFAGGAGMLGGGGGLSIGGGLFGGGSQGGGIFSMLGKMFGFGGGGGEALGTLDTSMATSDLLSFGGFLADGGNVDPGAAYVVGDRGEPEWFVPHSAGSVVPSSKMGGSHQYYIDARGADLGVEHRVARAMEAAHNSAVATSVRANNERSKRTPQRSNG